MSSLQTGWQYQACNATAVRDGEAGEHALPYGYCAIARLHKLAFQGWQKGLAGALGVVFLLVFQ